jgi:hypothetical protein
MLPGLTLIATYYWYRAAAGANPADVICCLALSLYWYYCFFNCWNQAKKLILRVLSSCFDGINRAIVGLLMYVNQLI